MKKCIVVIVLLMQLAAFSQSNYKIIAYYTGSAENIRQYPLNKLTHVIYSFLKFQNDTLAFRDSAQMKNVQQLIALKSEYPQLKVMVSIGGWGWLCTLLRLVDTVAYRNTFVKTAVQLLKDNNIDGLDLDWEYPVIEGYPGHQYLPQDKANFTALVKELRAQMGDKLLLTFAAGGFNQYLQNSIDWAAVVPQIDFINLMTYDLVGWLQQGNGAPYPVKRPPARAGDYRKLRELVIE